jgi:hypothetical protein
VTLLRIALQLPAPLAERAEADARRRRLLLPDWIAEVVSCHLADARCQHIGRLPAPADADDEPADDEDAEA